MAVLLYVDDDPAFLDLVTTHLDRRLDNVIIETTTDPEAVLADLASFGDVHCVLTDYDMSPMDGIELLTGLRDADADLPVVLYTSRGSEAVASEAISAGVTDYVRKEGTSDHYDLLANRLRSAMDHYRSVREAKTLNRRKARILRHTTERFLFLDRDWTILDLNDMTVEVFGDEGDEREDLLGENFLDIADGITDDPEGNPFLTTYRVAMAENEPMEVVGRPEAEREPGRWIEARAHPSPEGLSIFVRDVSYRERHRRRFRRLVRESARFTRCETATEVYETVADLATDDLAFDGCAIFLPHEGQLDDAIRAFGGGVDVDAGVEFDESTVGPTSRDGTVRRVSHGGGDRTSTGESEYRSTVSVPLRDDAVVQVVSIDRRALDDDDVELIDLLANRAAMALDRIDRERLLDERAKRIETLEAELAELTESTERDAIVADESVGPASAGEPSDQEDRTDWT